MGAINGTAENVLLDIEVADYVIEQGTSGIWTYEKWASGKCALRCQVTNTIDFSALTGVGRSDVFWVALPFTVYGTDAWFECTDINAWASCGSFPESTSRVSYVVWRPYSYEAYTYYTKILVIGRWK